MVKEDRLLLFVEPLVWMTSSGVQSWGYRKILKRDSELEASCSKLVISVNIIRNLAIESVPHVRGLKEVLVIA